MKEKEISYCESGVNIEEGYKTVSRIKDHAKRTHSKNVMGNIGGFGAMYSIPKGYDEPVLVSGTDGVGTKLKIAMDRKKYHGVGIDCVAMCVNDILCHGAKPLFFLDYIACGKLDSKVAAEIVHGISDGCMLSDASLVGGETAEMPGFYDEGKYDIAGFAVGVVEKSRIIDGAGISEDDVLIGIASSGVHSNGFSLVRMIVKDLDEEIDGVSLGDRLLEPTKIYVKPVMKVLEKFNVEGMAHITGGGLYENIPRMIPEGLRPVVDKKSIPENIVFSKIRQLGVAEDEMFRTFNMGVGFVICAKSDDVKGILKTLAEEGEDAFVMGHIERGEGLCLR